MSNVTRLAPHPANSAVNPVIAVTVKDVYGNRLVYPANTQAEILAGIAGTKTLTSDTLIKAQAMGFRVVAVAQIIFLIAHVDATKLHAAVTPVIW